MEGRALAIVSQPKISWTGGLKKAQSHARGGHWWTIRNHGARDVEPWTPRRWANNCFHLDIFWGRESWNAAERPSSSEIPDNVVVAVIVEHEPERNDS